MTHPTREQWMSYLHDETNGAEGRALQQHLGECAECRAQVTSWQETRRRLDIWKLAPLRPRASGWFAWPRLAAAAAAAVVLVTAGLAGGRSIAPSRSEVASLRAEVESLKAGMEARVEVAARSGSEMLMREFTAMLNSRLLAMQTEQVSDYVSLRRELETVAVLTQAGFNQTENRLGQLASASQPDPNQ